MMHPSDSEYFSRPSKRARGSSASVMPNPDPHATSTPPSMASANDEQGVQQTNAQQHPATGPSSTMSSRARGEDRTRKLSCKECRRLKLKCDRVFPCQSCVKRGCGSLCPEGALTAGRGSRFILANTEQLHDKISELSERVRQLEEALEELQAEHSNQPHPLLATELLKIKTSQELYGTMPLPPLPSVRATPPAQDSSTNALNVPPLIQTQQTRQQQKEDHLRESVVALSLNNVPANSKPTAAGTCAVMGSSTPLLGPRREFTPPEVPDEILQLSTMFPFPWTMNMSIRKRIREALPPREEAEIICREARNNALWQYNLNTAETFLPNLLHYCYATPIEDLRPRRLALLLMVLSIGSLVDLNRPLGAVHGEAYHHLARASICEIPLMEEPDFDGLHALFFMIYYHLIFSDNRNAIGYAWNLMGFVAKLAQGLGLHREARGSSKMIPEEHDRRRAIFWELLNMDCRMSLSLGRPPSISLAHVDARPPAYVGAGIYVPREEIVYHEWKNNFFIQCLTPILQAMVTVQPPDYPTILELDKKTRDFSVPSLLDEQNSRNATPRFLVMQRGLVTMGRDIALLQLHRRYFTEAMNSSTQFDMNHNYAPSVLATYLSASNLIATVENLFEQEQQLTARFLYFWFNVFSSAVMLSLFISRAPTAPLANYALQDLERICQLFRRAATILPFSAKVLPQLTKLTDKCRSILRHNSPSTSLIPSGNPYPVVLPPSFQQAHHSLSDYADRMRLTAPTIRNRGNMTALPTAPSVSSSASSTKGDLHETLPDIYHFASMGVGVESRSAFAPTPSVPFVPSSPRVAKDEQFNFDYGALGAELEDTSYMAWF